MSLLLALDINFKPVQYETMHIIFENKKYRNRSQFQDPFLL